MLQFAFAVLLPVFASVIMTQVFERTSWGKKVGYWPKQIIFGLIFSVFIFRFRRFRLFLQVVDNIFEFIQKRLLTNSIDLEEHCLASA